MTDTAGEIRLDTLDQAEYWVDRHGNRHELSSMTQGYLENTRGHLRRRAGALYSLELRRQDDLLLIAALNGWDTGRDTKALPTGTAAAGEWLNSTPLVRAITAMLDGN